MLFDRSLQSHEGNVMGAVVPFRMKEHFVCLNLHSEYPVRPPLTHGHAESRLQHGRP